MKDVVERGPRDYVDIPWRIPSDWIVADVGPGTYPFRRANIFIDYDQYTLSKALEAVPNAKAMCTELEDGLADIPDKYFDYIWCSHLFEHLDNPMKCARVLSRVGKRGTLVIPGAIKEGLFNFEERQHKWLILPHPSGRGGPIFVSHHPDIAQLKDPDIQKSLCRLFRSRPGHNCCEADFLREWFWQKEKYLDVIYHWEGSLEIMVIQ